MRFLLILVTFILFVNQDLYAAALRSSVQVSGDVVTLGDLVDEAGDKAGVALFRAPALGQSGVISSHRIIEAAATHGLLLGEGPESPRQVTVWRDSRMIDRDQIKTAAISEMRHRRLVDPTTESDLISITSIQMSDVVHLPTDSTAPLAIRDFFHDPKTGQFSMDVSVAAPRGGQGWSTRVQGHLARMIEVPVIMRAVGRLEIIGPDDVEMQRVEASATNDTAVRYADIVGQAAKRRLGAGTIVQSNDLTKPILVRRNATVPIVFQSGRLLLTAQGRAISDGSEGDLVKVLNTKSHRVLEGVVQSSGAVAILPKPISVASTTAIVQ